MSKKLTVIIVSIVFALVVAFSCVALFTVKKIEVDYAVGENVDTISVQKKLDEYLGKNLIFFNEEQIKDSLTDFHYAEIVLVEKSFPNVIKVELTERKEVYELVSGETVYVTAENGLVLRSFALENQTPSRDRIRLELVDINVLDATYGKVITTDEDELLAEAFLMAKSVHLTNCIESVKLEKATVFKGKATFRTYTGVNIVIRELLDDGVKKIETAFIKYDNATDYEKTFKQIEVIKLSDTGEITAQWTEEDGSNQNAQ